jgi:hypothetical protein
VGSTNDERSDGVTPRRGCPGRIGPDGFYGSGWGETVFEDCPQHLRPHLRNRRRPTHRKSGQKGGSAARFTVDAERAGSLFDGRLSGAQREGVLERLAASDDDEFGAFADTAAVLRETESEEPEQEGGYSV